ncbi:MAG TPA: hypothetical protein VKK79_00160, partial [Candidatus Lokiarchaeia archaeon]|nr:hypothetical protein [Candidatus Lokiarchaeia archaeon]
FDERWQLIESLFPDSGRLAHAVGKILPARDLMDFFEEIVQQGQEGLVVRNPETFKAYKIKPVHSIDAVIVGAVDGFENSKILPGQLSSALVALRYPDGRYQLLTKVGSGLTEDERAALWRRLEFANQPNFVAATPDGRSYHMVRPTVVVEIDYFEIHTNRRDGTPTEQNALEYDANTNAWHVLRPLPFPKVRFPRFHDTHPIRDDKTGDIINVRVSQVLDLVSGSQVPPEFTPIDLPPSIMLARYVFTKGDSMVRKFLLWRTNKRAAQANFPDFIIYSLDYSLGRKNNPFQRRLLVTNDEEQAWSMLEENAATEMSGKGGLIMRGWDVQSFFDERQPEAPRPLLKFLGTGEVRPARAAKNARKKAAKKAAKKSAKSASARVVKPKPEIPSTFPRAKPGIKPRSPSISSVIKESEFQPPLTASPPVLVYAVASRVPRVTEKAVCVENATGSMLWIPKIVIVPSDSAPTQVIDGPWSFAVKEWFAKKSEFNTWLAGQE